MGERDWENNKSEVIQSQSLISDFLLGHIANPGGICAFLLFMKVRLPTHLSYLPSLG
jgi:hypothetical protein